MSSAFKVGGQEDIHQFTGQTRSHNPSAKADDVGVVVESGVLGAVVVAAQGGADASDLVGGHGDADSGSAAENSFFSLS